MTERAFWEPYCGLAPAPADLLARWNFDPVLLLALALAGAWSIRSTPSETRGYAGLSLFMALILFVSPLCPLTSALFSARSAHHVLLTTLTAYFAAAALPRRVPGGLPFWTASSAIALWLWHAPPLYAAALSSDLVYWLMQASLLVTAAGFWSGVRHAAPGGAIIALLTYMVQMGLLGALLTFSAGAFYAPHALSTAAWGMTQLEDQQLGGIIMWVPGATAYLLAALVPMRQLLEVEREPAAA